MIIDDLKLLLVAGDIPKLKTVFEAHCGTQDLVASLLVTNKQYDPALHDVMDPLIRRDKAIADADGKEIGKVRVNRIPLPIQKKIVKTAAMFLGAPEIQSTPKGDAEEKMAAGLLKVWDDNKMDYKFKDIIKKTLSERECAVIWYTQEADKTYWNGTEVKSKFRLRAKLLGPSFGDTLYPIYDDFGDMIAFGRGYKIKNMEGKDVEYLDIETAEFIYTSSLETGAWVTTSVKNETGKIRIIYFKHKIAWEDVELIIKRLETLGSRFSDTVDYNGMPILVGSGKIVSMSGKEETGKVVELENGAKLDYLTNNATPESVKLEFELLTKYIYSLSHTPDISFENLKNLGYFSTAAFKAFFIDAHLNASDNEQVFGEGAQRMINLLKATLAILDTSLAPALPMPVKPKFTYFLPENFTEELDNISKAKNNGIMSKETAIKLNPLITDHEAEIEAVLAEDKAKEAADAEKAKLSRVFPVDN